MARWIVAVIIEPVNASVDHLSPADDVINAISGTGTLIRATDVCHVPVTLSVVWIEIVTPTRVNVTASQASLV